MCTDSNGEEPSDNQEAIKFTEPAAKLPQAGFAVEDDSAKPTDKAQSGLITRRELVLLRHLCDIFETLGITRKQLRDEMEQLSGCRSRKDLTTADAFRVISSFAHTLNELLATRAKQ